VSEPDYIPLDMLWSSAEITEEIGAHRNDIDWVPRQMPDGGCIVQDSKGRLVPPPTTKQKDL
jgi:hypothetical protein